VVARGTPGSVCEKRIRTPARNTPEDLVALLGSAVVVSRILRVSVHALEAVGLEARPNWI